MFLKYFIILINKFSKGFRRQMFGLLLMAITGGFLELLGIAMLFPVIMILTSAKSAGGQLILNYCAKFFPNASEMTIALCLSLVMIGIFLFKNLFMISYIKIQNDFVKKWSDAINKDVIKKLLYAPYSSVMALDYGEKHTLLSSLIRDVSLDFMLRCIILLANGIVAFCIICLLFWKFTLPAFLSTAFIIVFAYIENNVFKTKAHSLGEVGVKLLADLSKSTNFILQSQKEIVISGKQEYFANYLTEKTENISDNFSKRISWGNYPLYVTEIGVIFSFLIIVLSIVLSDSITKTEIVASLAVITLIVLRLVPQINKVLISMYSINLTKGKVVEFLEKYEKISKLQTEEHKNVPKMDFNDKIELKDVSFNYGDRAGIKNINLTIEKGDFIGIIGESGAGKTTLADVISGIFIPSEGEIFVDGTKIEPNNLTSYQKNISFLPQEVVLLNDTIAKNVAWGENEIDCNRVEECLKKAGLEVDIDEIAELSTGQKHRVALARIYYRDSEILILDEATSSLDIKSEEIVTKNLSSMKGEKTIIAIAHRLSTLKECNKIVYIENGQIKDIGTFLDLRLKYQEIDAMLKTSSFN